jgi:hypothetical protein
MAFAMSVGDRRAWLACLGVLALGCGSSATEKKPDASGQADAIESRDVWKADGPAAADDVTPAPRDVPDDGKVMVDASVGLSDTRAPDTGSPVDVGVADAPTNADSMLDAAADGGKEAGQPAEAGAGDVFWSSVVRFCAGTGPLTGNRYCRTVKDCGPTGPIVCSLGYYDWGPSACPIPPSMQPCPAECTADKDCTARAGGKCNVFTRACPRCDGHTCSYPPPPCTSSPNSCGTGQRCRTDGTCEPIPCTEGNACPTGFRCNPSSAKAGQQGCEPTPCTEGYTCGADLRCNPAASRADLNGCEAIPCNAGHTCPAETRCNVGSSRADIYGCEYVPCSEGYACPENYRCTVSAPAALSHGCTGLSCSSDGDCDCGYCVNGVCSADPGTCQTPPS